MASSLLLSPLSCPTFADNREVGSSIVLHQSTFLPRSNFFFPTSVRSRRPYGVGGCCYRSPVAKSLDHIPKQFRKENLKDGLLNNYKNAPQYLYGLTPSQMDMFLTEDNPARRLSESVTEESISSCYNYLNNGGVWSMSGMNKAAPPTANMNVSMYGGGVESDIDIEPPDLPSLLLDARIVYLGMPIVESVTELVVAQFLWLDYDDPSKPIHLYINSPGTQNEEMETVGSETEAYAIADMMEYVESDVYTINCGMAFGQAAMLLSLGKKGYRAMQPHSSTKLYLPKVSKSTGAAVDMWIKAKELESNAEYYLELLEKGTGKPKEEIEKDILRPKYFRALEAIDYGLADKILDSKDDAFEKPNYDEMLRAMSAPSGPGFR